MTIEKQNSITTRATDNGLPATGSNSRGVTVVLILAFMGIFLFLLSTITSYVFTQGKYGRALYAREQALSIAEAGLEYYRWFLAHNPTIMDAGVGLVTPYTHVVNDPEASRVGAATVTATTNLACGKVQWVDLKSVGTSDTNVLFKRTLNARYMRPVVAEYSALLNANVWAGADRVITGPYFSNGGIRMDAQHNSMVQSAVATWSCDSSFGCSPTQSKNGVFGGGSSPALWSYPAASFNFAGIATNFATMQTYATNAGIMLAPTTIRVAGVQQGGSFASVGGSDQRGFRIVLRADNKIDVYRVTGTSYVESIHADDLNTWVRDYHTITSQTFQGTYTIPSGCPVIFSQAKLWLEGVVGSKVTVYAADTGAFSPDIILSGNITYGSATGSSGLTATAERSVIIPLVSPDTMTARGIFVAQSGYFGRNYYTSSGAHAVPGAYAAYVMRSQLSTIGTVVSNGRIGTQWTCGGVVCSGYAQRIDTYDRLLAFNPPPFTPAASPDYKLVLWREE